jgi:conjugative relaxase-like TrwC/TraI family protein
MLTIAVVKNSEAARQYYSEADNYYAADRSPSLWAGRGAQHLGLAGAVAPEEFFRLLDGDLPDGSHVPCTTDVRRAGFDLTFSAPKSLSIQALAGGDERLVDAHQAAVLHALSYVEGLAAYRVKENRVASVMQSGNLIVACFLHDLSRDVDPQLHSHAVVINATRRADGHWRALEAGELFRQKMLVGALYRAELAAEVRKLGYGVRLTRSDGLFELSHITDRQVDAFSSRSAAIEAALAVRGKTRGQATHHEKSLATLATRNGKGGVDRVTLRQVWLEQCVELGVDLSPRLMREPPGPEQRAEGARDAVSFSVAHHTERQAVVTTAQILATALAHGTGRTDLAAIQSEIDHQCRCGDLIEAHGNYTTHLAQEREREILAVEVRGRGAVAPILSEAQARQALAEQALADTTLTPGQHAAAMLVSTTDNRLVAVQGLAGTGKTTMLRQAAAIVRERDYRVVGIAQTATAVRELSNEGIDSETIAAFIHGSAFSLTHRTVLIVDEAGMVSARGMRNILVRLEAAYARGVLVGDLQQLKSIEAGKPFAQLQAAGIARVEMSEIIRQHDARLRHAVKLAAAGDIEQSVSALGRRIMVIEDYHDRHQRIAKDFAALSPDERNTTLIVSGTRAARASINERVRMSLGLAGVGMVVVTLERRDLTIAQAQSSLSYSPGDIVQAQKKYASLELERGDWARVMGTVAPGRVALVQRDGVEVEWRPAVQTHMAAYRESERELSVGDAIRFTTNEHERDIVNGERATVVAVDMPRRTLTVRRVDGRLLTLDAATPLHLDHGYCTTVYSSQSRTVDRVLIDADTASLTANQSAWYVAISRARNAVTIYTDSRESLPEAMSREDAKSSALDLVAENENPADDTLDNPNGNNVPMGA